MNYIHFRPFEEVWLLEEDVGFYLVHRRPDGGRLPEILDLLPREVGDANRAHFALFHERFHGGPRLADRHVNDVDLFRHRVDGEALRIVVGFLERHRPVYLIASAYFACDSRSPFASVPGINRRNRSGDRLAWCRARARHPSPCGECSKACR